MHGSHGSLFIPGALIISLAIEVVVEPDAGPTALDGDGPFTSDQGQGFWSWWDDLQKILDRVQVTGTKLVAPG